MSKTIKFICILFSINFLLSSCTIGFSKDTDRSFLILATNFELEIAYLKQEFYHKFKTPSEIIEGENIEIQEPNLDSLRASKAKRYHKITLDYEEFLSDIEQTFLTNPENPLYYNDKMTQKGAAYMSRAKAYLTKIKKLWNNEDMNHKLDRIVSTKPFEDNEGATIPHLTYYFDNLPLYGIVLYLKQKRYNILALEKDFLNAHNFQNNTN